MAGQAAVTAGSDMSRRSLLGMAGTIGMGLTPLRAFGSSVISESPVDHGARGIGETFDDAPAIQAAVDAVWRRGGGQVAFPRPSRFFNVRRSIVCRPGVSLVGSSIKPAIKSLDPATPVLLPGNFHPAFVSQARYDPLGDTVAGTSTVELQDGAAARRYRLGDQLFITSRAWGDTGAFGIPHYGWLNIVAGISGRTLRLRRPIDRAVAAQVTPLRETMARNGVPLFFHADASIRDLDIQAAGHWINDSAMLNVDIARNRIRAASAVYGNCSQFVRWLDNDFAFERMIGEQSLNSLSTIVAHNRFTYDPGQHDAGEAGLYLQEYARNISIIDNDVDVGAFPGPNFLVSIANTQDVVVEQLRAKGRRISQIIHIGSTGTADFPVSGNYVRNSTFGIANVTRLVHVDGCDTLFTHDNGILDCTFGGTARAGDAIRIQRAPGRFEFRRNRWQQGSCLTMGGARGLQASDNHRSGQSGALCRSIA